MSNSTNSVNEQMQFSTAYDMAVIATAAMREHPLFRKIVATKHYECQSRASNSRTLQWQNTNKLLWRSKKILGLKTGWTKSAGPCLCSAVRLSVTQTMRSQNDVENHDLSNAEEFGGNRGERIESKELQFRDVLIVTLHSESTAARWPEHRKLHSWVQRFAE